MNASITNTNVSSLAEAQSTVDVSWKGVYRIGGIALVAAGILVLIGTTFGYYLGTPPGNNEAYLQALANHPALARLTYWSWVFIDILLIIGMLGLYLALKGINKNAMLVAAGLVGLFLILDLGITEFNSLTLITLTQSYAAATSDAQRLAYQAAENWGLATIPIASFFSWMGPSTGFLIVAIVMQKSGFGKFTANLGMISNGLGILCSLYFLLPVPLLSILLTPVLIAYGIWHIAAGRRLFRLGRIE